MNPIKKILFPTDFSEGSTIAAQYAIQMAKTYKAELDLIHSFNFNPYIGIGEATWVSGQVIQDAEDSIRKELMSMAKKMEDGIKINHYLNVDITSPADAICEYANEHEIDLIVIAKHGRKGIDRLLLGSVTEKVIRQSHCPVLVIPVFGSTK